jgi:hypothetical protein
VRTRLRVVLACVCLCAHACVLRCRTAVRPHRKSGAGKRQRLRLSEPFNRVRPIDTAVPVASKTAPSLRYESLSRFLIG